MIKDFIEYVYLFICNKLVSDQLLLEIYLKGFNNELNGEEHSFTSSNIYKVYAYNLGKINAYVGDDISSIDLQTNAEILKQIRSLI